MERLAKKVLLIGWDAADWKIINKMMDEGIMPHMEKFVNSGVMGNLATLDPPFSPMLWTTIATGMRPDKHGILGFSEPVPNQSGVRPVSSYSRKVKAIWNILTHEKLKTHVVGWWPSHPAEPINGIMVSNHYQHASVPLNTPWPLLPGSIYPPELHGLFAHFRVHPGELTAQHIQPFVPDFEKVDQDNDKRLEQIAKVIAETASIHAAATLIMENQEWDFMGVYFDAIDHFCHGFMNFHPPKMPNVPEETFNLYSNVITSAYRYHDMILGRLLELAGEETTVMLISDHGFHSDHLRPLYIPVEPAGPAYQHRNYGIFCVKGPNIKKDERIYGASLLDITPTLLTLFGLPIGTDMDGTPLVQIFDNEIEISQIPSWEKITGDSGMHSKELREDPYEAQEALKQLIELGYIENPGDNIQGAVDRTIKESQYNLGRVYLGASNYKKALPIFEELYHNEQDQPRFAFRLAQCYKELRQYEECRKLVETFRLLEKEQSSEESLNKIKDEKKPEGLTKEQEENWAKQRHNKFTRFKQAHDDLLMLVILEGEILLLENKPEEALVLFKNLQKKGVGKQISYQLGTAFIMTKQYQLAEKEFNKIIKIDPDHHLALTGLAEAYLGQGKFEDAADAALSAVGLLYYSPFAHLHLGQALFDLGEYKQAEQALKVCLLMNPRLGFARNLLIQLYEGALHLPEKAVEHKLYLEGKDIPEEMSLEPVTKSEETSRSFESQQIWPLMKTGKPGKLPTIYIVSGLPRSGTSMMMQMLEAGGLEIFTDKMRQADESNPKGYYEHEAVKKLARDKKWLKAASGKVIKVVAQLLPFLPPRFHYKVIFMHRDIKEVVMSQHKMLLSQNSKRVKEGAYPLGIETAFKKSLEKVNDWNSKNYNVEILNINYTDVIDNPENQANVINQFLGGKLDSTKMINAVDRKLYRIKL